MHSMTLPGQVQPQRSESARACHCSSAQVRSVGRSTIHEETAGEVGPLLDFATACMARGWCMLDTLRCGMQVSGGSREGAEDSYLERRESVF